MWFRQDTPREGLRHLVSFNNDDGRIDLFGLDPFGSVWHRAELVFGLGWGSCADIPGLLGIFLECPLDAVARRGHLCSREHPYRTVYVEPRALSRNWWWPPCWCRNGGDT